LCLSLRLLGYLFASQSFLQTFRPDMDSSTTFNLSTIDNGTDTQDPSLAGTEANLDIQVRTRLRVSKAYTHENPPQYTVGLATGVPISFLSVGNNTEDGELEGFLDTVNFAAAQDTVPTVMSTSYGEDEDALSPALSYQMCAAFAALGARGVSILFASGDSGVGAQNGTDCGAQFVPKAFVGCP
jgi:tripeptidyl-peptidase-1